jgi:hypothetical protein
MSGAPQPVSQVPEETQPRACTPSPVAPCREIGHDTLGIIGPYARRAVALVASSTGVFQRGAPERSLQLASGRSDQEAYRSGEELSE